MQTLLDYKGTFFYLQSDKNYKKPPDMIKTPDNFEIDNMIFQYAETFGLNPKEVENQITELEYTEQSCYRANKNAHELSQMTKN